MSKCLRRRSSSSSAAQNNLGSSRSRRQSYHADPTPIHWFRAAVHRATRYPDQHRPTHCPQCQAKHPLTAHGFYTRTMIDSAFDGLIRVRRYLCQACRRTVSLLPEFALPYLRSSVTVIALFLMARLAPGENSRRRAATFVALPARPVLAAPLPRASRRFVRRAGRVDPAAPAPDFTHRALTMLASAGWIPAHRFLFADLRQHLLGLAAVRWLPTAGVPRSPPPPRPLDAPHTPFAWRPAAFSPYPQTR